MALCSKGEDTMDKENLKAFCGGLGLTEVGIALAGCRCLILCRKCVP